MKPWFKRFRAFQFLIGLKIFGNKFQEIRSQEIFEMPHFSHLSLKIQKGLSSYIDVGDVDVGDQICWSEDVTNIDIWSSTSANRHQL